MPNLVKTSNRAHKHRYALLGPVLLLVGLAAGTAGVVWLRQAQATPGPYIDAFALDDHAYLAIRAQANGPYAFAELVEHNVLKWRALLPGYAGHVGQPGIAYSADAITLRVARAGQAELFALSRKDARKLASMRLADQPLPSTNPHRLVTLSNGKQGCEFVASQPPALVAVDFARGKPQWRVTLPNEIYVAGAMDDTHVWVQTAQGQTFAFALASGTPVEPAPVMPAPRDSRVAGQLRLQVTPERILTAPAP